MKNRVTRRHSIRAASCLIVVLFLSTRLSSLFAGEVTLLPLGDSITENDQYRYALWKKFIDDGQDVNMIGTRESVRKRPDYKGQKFDADHEGYWGISTEWLYRKAKGFSLQERLEKIRKDNGGRLVDFVTYHIGTNDINTDDMAHGKKYVDSTTLPFIGRTIDALRVHNPDVTIFLCKIIPIVNGQSVRENLVDYLNSKIDGLAAEKNRGNERSRVIVVDQNRGFHSTKGVDTYDGMHPNTHGGEKMAERFYSAIEAHQRAHPPAARSAEVPAETPVKTLVKTIEPDGWSEVQRLLRRCRGVYRELPRDVVTPAYCGGPLLGNGEIGAAIGGDAASQTIYVNRLDFWRHGLGGVVITAEGEGGKPDAYRYVQDIERGEIRSSITISGHPTTMKTWVAVKQPLVICEVTNTSAQAVTYQIDTWAKGPANREGVPICLRQGAYPNGLRDTGDEVGLSHDAPNHAGEWILEAANTEGQVYLKNVSTGRYLYVADKAATKVHAGTVDPSQTPGVVWEMPNMLNTCHFKNVLTGKALQCGETGLTVGEASSANRNKLNWSVEFPERVFNPEYAGCNQTVCWAQREYSAGNYAARAAIVTRVLGGRDLVLDQASAMVTLSGGETVRLVIAVDGDGDRKTLTEPLSKCLQRGKDRVMSMTPETIAELTRDRIVWWRDFWLKSYVDLGDELLNRFWYGAFYALACTSRGNHECPGLWGAWITLEFPAWGNAKTLNYNYQAPYYGVYSGNHLELAEPYYGDVLYHLPWAQDLAARAGYRGAMFSRIMGPQGTVDIPSPPRPVAATKDRKRLPNDQLDAMAFVAIHFINHYAYTLDEHFLREKAWPVMLASADFYEDYLVFEDGRYVFKESAAREGGGDTNPCYPLAYVSFVLRSCLQVADRMGVADDRQEKWRHLIDHMSAFPTMEVGGKMVLKEAESLSKVTIRGPGDNVSLLQTIHPGEGINLGSDPHWVDVALNTIQYLNSDPARYSWFQHNNFPMIFAQAARVGWDAEDLWRQLKMRIIVEMRPNLTVYEWGGGIETSGGTEAVHSMLMQGHEDVIRLFPVWPQDRDAKFVRLRAKGAFVVSSMLKGGDVQYVRVYSEHGKDCVMVNPWSDRRVALHRNGKIAEALEGERFTLKTVAGETLLLGPLGISYEDLQGRMTKSIRPDDASLVNRFDTERDFQRLMIADVYPRERPRWIDQPGEGERNPNPGRQGIVAVHPRSIEVASVLSRMVSISDSGTPVLRVVTSGDPWKGEADYVLQVGIDDGESVEWFDAEIITAGPTPSKDGWTTFEYDLTKYANQTVTILVKAGCGGKHPWNNDRAYFDEISVIMK